MGYLGGASLFAYVTSDPMTKIDPKGLWDDIPEPIERDVRYFCNRYRDVFGERPHNVNAGCIGITRDLIGKTKLFDSDTECFESNDIELTKKRALAVYASKKCGKCSFPAMFAYRYWAATNGHLPRGCPGCGRLNDPPMIPKGDPGDAPSDSPNFDFCASVDDGIWIGGNHGDSKDDQTVIIWPSLERFNKSYPGVYDVTVVCVTCTGKEFSRPRWIFDPNLSEGPATEEELSCIRESWGILQPEYLPRIMPPHPVPVPGGAGY